jgi:L-alanine-DL-glutamate epimerase-like enolase superfamily enzyme
MPICPHFLMELHVGLTAAVPNGRWVEHIPQLDEITLRGMRIEAGHAIPSEEPGLGIAWDMTAIEQRRVHELTLLVD